jgi:SAM-dependent methyltransferase
MKDWLRDCLVDPVERAPLSFAGDRLVARNGANYPIVEGIPVLLRADLPATHRGAMRTLKLADMARQGLPIDLIAAVNLREELKEQIRREIAAGSDAAEAVIRRLVPLSNGFGYRDLAPGHEIPIPQFDARGHGESLLDIGSSWGRWTIAAARAGFHAVGLDPMLGPLMAAKRFAAKNGVDVDYICGDARCLPFADGAFDRAFSYSTLQHFSDRDYALTLGEIARVLGPDGSSTVQMAHWAGVRCGTRPAAALGSRRVSSFATAHCRGCLRCSKPRSGRRPQQSIVSSAWGCRPPMPATCGRWRGWPPLPPNN